MEKTRITYNSARATCGFLVALSYATIENNRGIFPENPVAYSCGVYGWNCDYYYLADVKGDSWLSYEQERTLGKRYRKQLAKRLNAMIDRWGAER